MADTWNIGGRWDRLRDDRHALRVATARYRILRPRASRECSCSDERRCNGSAARAKRRTESMSLDLADGVHSSPASLT